MVEGIASYFFTGVAVATIAKFLYWDLNTQQRDAIVSAVALAACALYALYASGRWLQSRGIANKIAIGAIATYKLSDEGLANFLNLETLSHGTGPKGFWGINLNGADPSFGGNPTGSCKGANRPDFMEESKNYFHVFKDSEFLNDEYYMNYWVAKGLPRIHAILSGIGNFGASKALPRMHAILSGIANFGASTDEITTKPIRTLAGAVVGALTPILKFRFRPEEILGCTSNCRFENDPDYSDLAYRTAEPISPSHLGILGSFTQGINTGMFPRMAANPLKVLKGAALLVGACYVGKVTYCYYKQKPSDKKAQPAENQLPQSWKETAQKIAIIYLWGTEAVAVLLI